MSIFIFTMYGSKFSYSFVRNLRHINFIVEHHCIGSHGDEKLALRFRVCDRIKAPDFLDQMIKSSSIDGISAPLTDLAFING